MTANLPEAQLSAGAVAQDMLTPIPSAACDSIDTAAMAVLLDDLGSANVAAVIALFITDTRHRLIRLASLGMPAAAAANEVHSLKGAASAVCAARLSDAASWLEARLKAGAMLESADLVGLNNLFELYQTALKAG